MQVGGDEVDDEFGAKGVDAEARRRRLGIADRGQRQAMARAQQQIDDAQYQHGDRQRHQVQDGFARGPVGRDLPHDGGRQRQAGTRAQHRDQARGEREDLGHHPGADREIGAAQPKHRERNRDRHQPRERSGEQQRHVHVHVQGAGQIEERVGAEPDVGLLADRDEAGITRQQIPELRQREVVGHLADQPHLTRLAPPRQRRQRGKSGHQRTMAKTRLARVARSTRTGVSMSVSRAREQPARANDQDEQEGEVAGEDLPGRRQRGAERLRDAQHHAANQRAPQAAEPADDHGLERQDQPDRPGRRIEIGADGKQHAGERREDHGDRHAPARTDGDCRCPSTRRCRHRRRRRETRGRAPCGRTEVAGCRSASTATPKTSSG